MKASLKFREEKPPLFKAKVPLNVIGFPFQSTLSTGDSKELCLTLATFFDSGPSFRFSYRPNDAFNPFSFIIKSGIGSFGSPNHAPMTMSAQFDFPSKNSNHTPAFFLHFKPRFGDFCLKKTQKSGVNSVFGDNSKRNDGVLGVEDEDGSIEVVEYFNKERITNLPLKSTVEEAVSGMELGAKTSLPIKSGAVLKFNWGVRLPEGFKKALFCNKGDSWISPRRIPLLGLNKISIEHVAKDDRREESVAANAVAETCVSVRKQLETMRSENALLGKALEELKEEFGSKGGKVKEFEGVTVADVTKGGNK